MPRKVVSFKAFTSLLVFLLLSLAAQATELTVNCAAKKNSSINGALAQLSKHGPNTILVSGACHEVVTIDGFDRLSLIGNAGASVSASDNWVISITGSNYVTVEGFAIDATAATGGVTCADLSVCILRDLTIDGGGNGGTGIMYVRSSGLVLRNTLIEHSGVGLALSDAKVTLSSDTTTFPVIRQNDGYGISINDGSTLTVIAVTIAGNGSDGINARSNSTLRTSRAAIQDNGGNGIKLQSASVGRIGNSNFSNNNGSGVRVGDLSFASFEGNNNMTAQGAPKVVCEPQFSATRGVGSVAASGETNCVEPAP